jgi:tetratricopeptide (TPR) repeat protein
MQTVMSPSAPEVIDLPAPKTKERREELPDLPTPVGPRSRKADLPDLLTPVGPTSRKASATDLLTPVGPTSQKNLPDLLTPVGPTSQKNLPDLLAPVGPTSQKNLPDLLAPVGPVPLRNAPDLLEPVGPTPVRNAPDLLAPVGPVPLRNAPDLLKPVGPTPVRNAPDLLAPVGAEARPDLVAPVGPTPVRNAPDLLAPVGPLPLRNAPDLVAPVGPEPTKGVDLPAPRGFFDESPPPRPSPGRTSTSVPPLDFDDLDVVPADAPSARPAPSEFGAGIGAPTSTSTPFNMDGLDLTSEAVEEPPEGILEPDVPYGEVDLPPQQDESTAGLISFSRPTGAARSAEQPSISAPPTGLTPKLDLATAVKPRAGTIAGEERGAAPSAAVVAPAAEPARRRAKLLLPVVALLALGGGAYYAYTSVELEVAGLVTAPAAERRARIATQLLTAQKLMLASEPGHWHRAADAALKAAALARDASAPQALEARGLAAQAHVAAAVDEGLKIQQDREAADALIGELLKAGTKHVEIEKAQALRSILDPSKGGDALVALEAVARKAPRDGNLPLYVGWAALEAGKPDQARDAFNRALELTPERRPALYGLGRAHMALGEDAKARESFQRVFDKHPQDRHFGAWLALTELTTPRHDPTGRREKELGVLAERAPERNAAHPRDRARAWVLYGDEALAAGRYEQAAERFRVARELDLRNLEALVGRAVAVIELRSASTGNQGTLTLTDARRELEQALLLEPAHVGALVGMTRISLLEGRPDEARKTIEQAVALDEKNARVHYWRGKVYEDPALADLTQAEVAYQRAIALAPRDYTSYVALSQLYMGRAAAAGKQGKTAEVKTWTDKALAVLQPIAEAARTDAHMANVLGSAYLGARDAARAEEWFRAALAVEDAFVDARANLAATLQAGGRADEALAELRKAHEQEPRREDIALDLALALERKKDFEGAEKIYATLLSTDSGNVPTLRARAAAGRYWARRDRVDLARAQGEIVAAAEPGNPAASFLLGVGLLADGKLLDAVTALREAVSLDPQAQYWEALGRAQEKQKSLGEAQVSFENAVRLDASYPAPLRGLGRVHLMRNDYAAALGVLERAARLDPEPAEVFVGMGDAHHALRHLDEAIAAYGQALARDADDAATHFKLGRVYFDDDRGAQSVAHLRRAIELAPQGTEWLPKAWRFLAYRQRANGNQAEMCRAFREYLELAPATDLLRDEVKRDSLGCP